MRRDVRVVAPPGAAFRPLCTPLPEPVERLRWEVVGIRDALVVTEDYGTLLLLLSSFKFKRDAVLVDNPDRVESVVVRGPDCGV